MKTKKKDGFTLVELVIVISIIMILISIALPRYNKTNMSAQVAAHNSNVKMIKNAAILYLSDNNDDTNIDQSKIGEYIGEYIDGKMPKPIKNIQGANQGSFTITITNGEIIISPGLVKVEGKNIVLVE